jgi:hypothetical protein
MPPMQQDGISELLPLYLLTDDDVKTHPIGKVYRWFARNLQRRGTISFEQIHAK